MRAARFPALWLVGLTLGVLGTGLLFRAATSGRFSDLVYGLALFVPGFYLSGNVLARARRIHRQSSRSPRRSRLHA